MYSVVWTPTVLVWVFRVEELRPFRIVPPVLQLYSPGVRTVPTRDEVSQDPWCPVCTAMVLVLSSDEVCVVMFLDIRELGLY